MDLDRVRRIIADADALILFTGAGMSADSGAPVFRGEGGFWQSYPAFKDLGLDFYQVASPRALKDSPSLFLGFYQHRKELYSSLTPHAGYMQLLNIMNTKLCGGYVVTSNVDGHHQKAGFEDVYEVHGSIDRWQCSSEACAFENGLIDAPALKLDNETMRVELSDEATCGKCGEFVRPNILLFFDDEFCDTRVNAQKEHFDAYLDRLESGYRRVAVLEIGAGTGVPTIRFEAAKVARRFNTKVIRINPEVAPDNQVYHIASKAIEGVNQVVQCLKECSLVQGRSS